MKVAFRVARVALLSRLGYAFELVHFTLLAGGSRRTG